ncbi:hypothetical protein A2738_03935 [Candidatus Nomurabacteria bacterium RIFCSPHIGHO2_01_FULL_42_15]|uniref:Bacterial sugar transferase domain-containing protein n=1 Tax=Candidatus Nomurabacteria bacterium RIFCSPHIGHO2_01_FULL_42_15 TaxID=1801742 RepID=A0A1F6VEG8_9BACT|nr:MAG: hypothetical protein A2738_03935 [Candidatus Nomurabacteria bacterium RIFCSPHIGHO2_01_FULL_42_15]OGI93353.1 MAG: hypothetical protein A3A99_03790 [Candidatus Nomurabacteria bacterium RIFCSPLOWO2_01_FULL_41_18]
MMYFIVKRIMDITISALALLLLAPLLFVIALFIKMDSPGPVFFAQSRVGYKKKIFKILKFRTMAKDADKVDIAVQQVRDWEINSNDPRVTRVGKWLRKTGVDEIPQFFNVLKGDMSLVGPRPYYQPRIDADPNLEERLSITPGCISLAIVSGRVRLSEEEIKKYDREYQNKRGLWLDIKILLKAVYLVISGKGF